jgi:hypothetical protein
MCSDDLMDDQDDEECLDADFDDGALEDCDCEECQCCREHPECCEHPDDPGIEMEHNPLDPSAVHDVDIVNFVGEAEDDDADRDYMHAIAVYVDGELQQWSFKDDDFYDGEEYADGLLDGLAMAGLAIDLTRYKSVAVIFEDEEPPAKFSEIEPSDMRVVEEV